MKKAATFILAVLVIAVSFSCEKTKKEVNKATEFDMNYSTEVSVPTSTLSIPTGSTQTIDFNTPEIQTQSSSRFISESTTQDLIDEIKMTKFTISNPNGNLNYLKSLFIYLKTSNGDLLVASKSTIPQNVSSLDAEIENLNIKEYIFKDKIQFKVKVTISLVSGSSGDQKLKTSQTMHVKGKRI